MAHSYTPGLRVAAIARVLRERRLPLKGEVVVHEGQAVEASTIIARTALPGDVTTVHVANLLSLDNADVPDAMQVREGEAVERDAVLARTGGFFGLFKGEVRSPLKGTVESISKVTGQVLLRGEPKPIAVDAYVRGTVADVIPDEGAQVASEGAFLQGIFGIGGETRGVLRMACDGPEQPLTPERLEVEHRGAIVVGGAFAGLDAIRRAIELRIAGLVVGGVAYASFTELLGKPIGVAVTGSETVGLTLIVTEGFGRIPMAARTFELLRSHEGREASIHGATQIRAGVIRPEILIPALAPGSGPAPGDPEPAGVEPGSLVRIIREPWFGELGRVVELPPEPRELETETRCRVARIHLNDGRDVVVPRSNLERIEE